MTYDNIYALFENVTPLFADCGQVCGRACCRGDLGMRLFPGEPVPSCGEMSFGKRTTEERSRSSRGSLIHGIMEESGDRRIFICGGRCDRSARPLACRIFPLFPVIDHGGRVRVVYDPRAYRLCPLVKYHRHVRLRRDFVRAVRFAGSLIAADPAGRDFLTEVTAEIDGFNRFLRLDEQRPPICRRGLIAQK